MTSIDPTRRVIEQQLAWAARRGLAVDPQGRTAHLEDNLFRPLHANTRAEFASGAGNELGSAGAPGDMQSLRSSSALVCNVFDYWRGRDLGSLTSACGADPRVSEVAFEVVFPTGLNGTPPHLDVMLAGPGALPTAIESKFTEIYAPHRDDFSDSYFRDPILWEGLPACRQLAEELRDRATIFMHLGAAQLLKHALGLERAFGHRGYRLLLLWYEVEGREAQALRDEIELLRDRVSGDVRFDARTYQELFAQLRPYLERHGQYRAYLEQRYFPLDVL